MTFLIRQISFTADGREIVRPRTVEKPQIGIGRDAASNIHLADLAVLPDHARVTRLDDRRLAVTASGTLGFGFDGRTVERAEIDLAEGAELRFGGHRITVSRGEAGEAVLSVLRVDALSDASEEKEEARVFSLRGLLPGKRLTAWATVLAILIGFLAVPIVSFATRPSEDVRSIHAMKTDQVKGDGAWSPGALSQAHHGLEGKCETCHQKAFVSVRDGACKTCHQTVHDHAPPARIAGARAAPGIGGAFLETVAHAFGKPGPGACVDCHREHEGAGPMPPTPQAFCADCHGSLKERLTDTKIADAADFGTAHPEFRPTVMANAPSFAYPVPRFERVSLASRPTEDGGLKFPHALHLSKTGGVARMAASMTAQQGFGDALACKDCHKPTADGVRFLPVDMKRDCQMCHSLAFETVGGTVRTLRHGDPAQVVADLTAYYRSTPPARPIQFGGMARRQPGDYAQGKLATAYAGAAARRPGSADAAIRAVFSKGGACYDCHSVVAPSEGKGWRIAPVRQPMRYMMHGWFDHAAHRTESCESCHAASKSADASQLMLPGIATCRTCHGGESSHSDVPSGCALCHSYHADDGAPWAPARRVAPAARTVAARMKPRTGG
jgi:predicted CXXCH cytochrome family protein